MTLKFRNGPFICFGRLGDVDGGGGKKSLKKIVCKSKKVEINCSMAQEGENKKFAD